METIFIPKPNDLVLYQDRLFTVISVDMGGKCKIKGFTTTKRFTKRYIVDISELTPFKK